MGWKKKYEKLKLSDIRLSKKGDRVELEGIVKGLVNYQGILRKTFSGFLIDKEPRYNPTGVDSIPIFGICDASAEATLKASMLKYSEETDTTVTIRGIIKETVYIRRRPTLLGIILKVKAISSKDYKTMLWYYTESA